MPVFVSDVPMLLASVVASVAFDLAVKIQVRNISLHRHVMVHHAMQAQVVGRIVVMSHVNMPGMPRSSATCVFSRTCLRLSMFHVPVLLPIVPVYVSASYGRFGFAATIALKPTVDGPPSPHVPTPTAI